MKQRLCVLFFLVSSTVVVNAMASELSPCPDTANCVSSQDKGRESYIEPMLYTEDLAAAKASLIQIINQQSRTEVIRNQGEYLHVTFTSRVFGFIDDVEFSFDDTNKIIHVRSKSRKGRYDFGANRRRVELLRSLFNEK